MNAPQSVEQFHAGGAALAGMQAVYDLSARSLDALVPRDGRLLDLGVGSGRGLGRFLTMRTDVEAIAIDLAPNMLTEARSFLDAEGAGDRASLLEGDLTSLPEEILASPWDAICSVWTLHHLPDRDALQEALRQLAQFRNRDGCAIWILDFQRLHDPDSLAAMQAVLEPDVPPTLHSDALASEAAAFTHEELRDELSTAGLGNLDSGLAQPIPWLQAFWATAQRPAPPPPQRARPLPLSGRADDDAARLLGSFSRLPI